MNQLDHEVQQNLFAFLPQLPGLLEEHEGSYAVMRSQKIEGIHKQLSDALSFAGTAFDDGIFSIQKITSRPQELGMFNSADNIG